MTKTYNIQTLLMDKAKEIVSASDDWMKFMSSSAYTYKYPFENQILIYAQRPDTRACASMEFWNKRFHRWVNKGAKGIPLIDYNSGGYPKLRYVFDIADTHVTRYTDRDVNLWKFDSEDHKNAISNLEKTFNINPTEGESIESRTFKISEELTKLRLTDILYDIESYKEGSLAECLDKFNMEVITRDIISKSVAFTILQRMELSPIEYFERDDFVEIINFNTFDMISILGSYTSQMTREINEELVIEIQKLQVGNKARQLNVQDILPKDIGSSL